MSEDDLTEEELDRMLAEGEPVEIVDPPGTPRARAEGCICPELWRGGTRRYRILHGCPVHS